MVAIHRVNCLRSSQRYSGIERIRARAVCRRDGMVVDRHGVVAGDEFNVGVFSSRTGIDDAGPAAAKLRGA
jgi:hypothetical protein